MHTPRSNPKTTHTARGARRASPAIRPGSPIPLGARWDGDGTNFSVFSAAGTHVQLCLFNRGTERRIDLQRTNSCWHVYLTGIGPGQQYGFRVHGAWIPEAGLRCNPAKLLLDPYARLIDGDVTWNAAVLPHLPGSDGETLNDLDSSAFVPRSVVIDPSFSWHGDRPPAHALEDTIIYELHVRGFSATNPNVPERIRGTYAGLAHPASIDYLQSLGVTTVELLPIHHFLHEPYILERSLTNYWGYNTIGFFAPQPAYATGQNGSDAVREFKTMVKTLHAAGIEVLLDVVYNHTAEGNHLGAMLSFKGFDNAAYYRLVPESPRHYMDFTGVGNTMDLRHPRTLQLVMDSLRYWVTEMHVDGFRFDLAVALARGDRDYDARSAFLAAVAQDPVLAGTKLIAEPWDVAEGGYHVGRFPSGWSEWNGRFRDTVRDYWRSQPGVIGDFATRLTGSADLYRADARAPTASINIVTVHDGFTLRDLVSYNEKHNEANGEDNRDGPNDNRSWNLGAEGPTEDARINELRARQARNFLATLLLSHGVPMILGGDECGRTQRGNNNAYCQDNDVSWMDWSSADVPLLEFTRAVIALRQKHGAFRRRGWPADRASKRARADVAWFAIGGLEMTADDWNNGASRSFSVLLDDRTEAAGSDRTARGEERFLLLFNAALDEVSFRLPSSRWGRSWTTAVDTVDTPTGGDVVEQHWPARAVINRPALSLLVLQCASPRLVPSASTP